MDAKIAGMAVAKSGLCRSEGSVFVATEESLSRCRDPSLRSGRHIPFLSSDFAIAIKLRVLRPAVCQQGDGSRLQKTSRPTPEGGLPLLRSRVNTLHIACLQAGRLPKNSLIVYPNLSSRWMFSAPFSDILTTEYL